MNKNFVSRALRMLSVLEVLILNAVDWKPMREDLEGLEKRGGRPFERERAAILK